MAKQPFIMAVPKGRILSELKPLLKICGIIPENGFFDESDRRLRFHTNSSTLDIIRVRSFDVATFVAYGGAQLGICGSDVLEEFDYTELYAPVDLNIGHCRLSVAMPADKTDAPQRGYLRVATKYPNLTTRHFAAQGIQAECIKLNGAMEIAPALGLATHIVDLVSSGATLKANNLREISTILDVSSRLIVNRSAMKTAPGALGEWIEKFRKTLK